MSQTPDAVPMTRPTSTPVFSRRQIESRLHNPAGACKVRVGKVRIARRGPVPPMPENPADQGQVLAGHHGLTGYRVPKFLQAKAAEFGVGADCAPAIPERIVALAVRKAPEHESVGIARAGQRHDLRLRGLAEQHRARASRLSATVPDIPPPSRTSLDHACSALARRSAAVRSRRACASSKLACIRIQ